MITVLDKVFTCHGIMVIVGNLEQGFCIFLKGYYVSGYSVKNIS